MAHPSLCVALTGATGFVGRHILPRLLQAGHRVRVLVRDHSKLTVSDSRLAEIEGDLFDEAATASLVKGADAVIHLVGIIMEDRNAGQTFERIHTEGTNRVLSAATIAGSVRKWVQMSALGVRPGAVAKYHRTKWVAEQAVRKSGMDYTIFRPSIIHGPDGEFMQMVRNWWCKRMPPFVPYFGKGFFGTRGGGKLQPVWVQDVAKCFVDAVTNPRASNETYLMGGPDAMTWPQLLRTVKKHLPAPRDKPVLAVPVWYANMIAGLPKVPFNKDQVIMSQEDSTCATGKVEHDFDFQLAGFEEKVAEYAPSM